MIEGLTPTLLVISRKGEPKIDMVVPSYRASGLISYFESIGYTVKTYYSSP